eukprot:s2391_g5.t1
MFIAKYLDQKQGEARVVDQQQVIRERLEVFLKQRPAAAELVERGVLGRDQRVAVARSVVEELLSPAGSKDIKVNFHLRVKEDGRCRSFASSMTSRAGDFKHCHLIDSGRTHVVQVPDDG